MLSPFFNPVEIDGIKFDRGMVLMEFDALREPEATQFPKIGAWVKSRIPMNEVPTPMMFWKGRFWPDLYIANQLDAVHEGWHGNQPYFSPEYFPKAKWPAKLSLETVSIACHGTEFHNEFIEPMCRKITGHSAADISAKYHRAIWLPLYWPETLRERKSIRTPFWYPKEGYAGAIIHAAIPERAVKANSESNGARPTAAYDYSAISTSYVLAKPRTPFSVLFVVDESPIYRITDMDVCAGIDTEWHRLIVESRDSPTGAMPPLTTPFVEAWKFIGEQRMQMPLPTINNVLAGWNPRPHLNSQLWEEMQRDNA